MCPFIADEFSCLAAFLTSLFERFLFVSQNLLVEIVKYAGSWAGVTCR